MPPQILDPHGLPHHRRRLFAAVRQVLIGGRFRDVRQHLPHRIPQDHAHGVKAVVRAARVPETRHGDLADVAGCDDFSP